MRRKPDDRVKLSLIYPHAPERIWRALTDKRALERWLMPNDFEPRLGHRFRFIPRTRRDGPGPVQCEVIELEAPRRLSYTWRADCDAEPSVVTWTLEPVEEGTRLRLEHVAPEAAAVTSADITDVLCEADWADRAFTMSALLGPAHGRVRRRSARRCGLLILSCRASRGAAASADACRRPAGRQIEPGRDSIAV